MAQDPDSDDGEDSFEHQEAGASAGSPTKEYKLRNGIKNKN